MYIIRKQRFERVTKNLKVTRVFSTLVEELKAINGSESKSKEVMTPREVQFYCSWVVA
jgi:hypothetical protein